MKINYRKYARYKLKIRVSLGQIRLRAPLFKHLAHSHKHPAPLGLLLKSWKIYLRHYQ